MNAMRKLKLQVQITVDGYVAGTQGELDWMTWDMDEKVTEYINAFTDSSDTILLGRKMTDGFVDYWTNVLTDPKNSDDPDKPGYNPEYAFAKKMVNTPKVVFTKTLTKSTWANTVLAKGNLVDEIAALKKRDGKDIVVYGGASFVSSLVNENLIDEYHLFVNPVAIGTGMTIFGTSTKRQKLSLIHSIPFPCGITVGCYKPQ